MSSFVDGDDPPVSDEARAGSDVWLPQPDLEDVEVATVLHALADPVRLDIVRILATRGETTCTALGLPQSPSTVTHHLRVLREAGAIATRIEGTARPSHLRREELERRFPGLLDSVLAAAPAR